jgi:hypothetical protein
LQHEGRIVSSVVIAAIVFACSFGGAIIGMALRGSLPAHYLSAESKELIAVTSGLLATLSALVLGLLVASAKEGFDAQEDGFQQLSSNVIVMDRLLVNYGPEANSARRELRKTVEALIAALWPADGATKSNFESAAVTADGEMLYDALQDLAPKNAAQRMVQSQAMQIGIDLSRTRSRLSQQQFSASSTPFMAVLVFWLFALFASFGLFAPRHRLAVTALLVSAMSTAGAVFLIADLNQPAGGLIQVSSAPLQSALSQLAE